MPTPPERQLSEDLLAWFDGAKRDLPWRDAPCGARDPYKVWLSEIMLQQTTVGAVIPYFERFLTRWPDVKALAAAPDDDILAAWAGLGYYARARNLIKCARAVALERQGSFPRAVADLQGLPGVGPYTAAAIAAIAFNVDATPVDGNVIRTIGRLFAIDAPMPAGKAHVQARADAMLPRGRAGDFAEALMDLGAGVCRAKNPDCPACPWQGACRARAAGAATAYPKKAPKKPKPTRRGWVFWVERDDGRVLLEKRPDDGLLGGMTGFPTTAWAETRPRAEDAAAAWPAADWRVLDGEVTHTFTHFHLELGVIRVTPSPPPPEGLWCRPETLGGQALPSVMRKVARCAQDV